MFVLVAGGGKVGSNVARSLMSHGHEVALIEQRPFRFERLEDEFEHRAIRGDATELYVLERAGIERPPDVLVAVTGDDEDNIVIGQVARERYGVEKVIARVNNPKNQEHFDFLGIAPTVSAVSSVLAMIEHEVPEHGLVHLLELRREDLDIVEVQIDKSSPCVGKRAAELGLPEGATVIAVMREGEAEGPEKAKELAPGDQVLVVLRRGKEDDLRKLLLSR
jgi:trk system potassium uptake protein TrkA